MFLLGLFLCPRMAGFSIVLSYIQALFIREGGLFSTIRPPPMSVAGSLAAVRVVLRDSLAFAAFV